MPFWDGNKEDIEELKDKIQEQEETIKDIKDELDDQKKDLDDIQTKLGTTEVDTVKEHVSDLGKTRDEHLHLITQIKDDISTVRKEIKDEASVQERHLENQEAALKAEIKDLKESTENAINSLQNEFVGIRSSVKSSADKMETISADITNKVQYIDTVVESLKEDIWELDSANRNNVIFYGVKEESGMNAEQTIRQIFKTQLNLGRDIVITRVKKGKGVTIRGTQPITVCLQTFKDKMEVLAKSKLLRGTNIMVTEDFPRRIQEHRAELTKFAKEVKKANPDVRLSLQYDRLYVESEPYIYNEETNSVEAVEHCEEVALQNRSALARKIYQTRKCNKSSPRRRVRKSISTDTDFQNYQQNSPHKRMVEDELSDHIDYDEHGIDDFD